MKKVEKEFQQINSLIERHWARAIGLANAESLMTYWAIGAYVSAKLKTAEWGSKVIEELCDFLKTHNPKRRGFGKRNVYNMVKFYDTYTGVEFDKLYERLRLYEFVQVPTAQSLQLAPARLTAEKGADGIEFVQSTIAQIDDIEFKCKGFPLFLSLTMSPMMVAEYRRLLIPEEVMRKSLAEYCAFMKNGITARTSREFAE